MTATDTARPAEPSLDLDPPPRAGEWQTALAVGRVEGVRLARALVVPSALALFMAVGRRNATFIDLRSHSYNFAFEFLLSAAVALVISHRAVTRPRREGAEELLTPLPAPPRAVTIGHLLAVGSGFGLAVLVAVVGMVVVFRAPHLVGDPVWTEIAVGPVLVAGAGCLGVFLGRMWPQVFVPYVACLVIAIFELNVASRAGSGSRWLAFWVEGSLWWAVLRHSGLHLVYLLGLVSMAVVGALVRHGMTRKLAVAGTVAIAVTAVAAGLQMRQPADEWQERNAMFAAPASVQSCEVRRGVRYCTFDGFRDMRGYFAERVERVRAAVPSEQWPAGLAVTQRVTALDLQYVGNPPPHLPDTPLGRVRQPDDGEIHPGIEFGWSPVQDLGLGTQVAAKAVALPVVPDPKDGAVCDASGQARAVLALWLGSQAEDEPGKGLRWLVERAEELVGTTGAAPAAVVAIAEQDVFGGFVVSLEDARLVLRLLERSRSEVASVVASQWDTLVDPSTPRDAFAAVLALPAPAVARTGPPVLANLDNDHASTGRGSFIRVGDPCR